MNIKRMLLTGCLLLLLCPCTALAEEEPIIYTVKDGDTLWGISQRFIKDPYYWPNLWSHNPDVGNPHLIYPGQVLRIYEGRIEIIPVTEEEPIAENETVITPESVELVSTYGGGRSFVGEEELDTLGTLVDTTENKILLGEQDKVFLEMKDLSSVKVGERFELIAIGDQIRHPITRKKIGYRIVQVGTVEIQEITPSVAVGLITDGLSEIKRGARLRPIVVIPPKIPRKLADKEMEGYIVSADEGRVALGQWDVIHIDIGSATGLEVGHELNIYRGRETTEFSLNEELQLPNVDLGDAIVLEVRKNYAEALITKIGKTPLYRGDHVVTKTR